MSEQENLKGKAATAEKAPVGQVKFVPQEEKINVSRRYFALGMFTTVFLFKGNLISPSYQISRTGKYTLKFTVLLVKLLKFLLWTGSKKK